MRSVLQGSVWYQPEIDAQMFGPQAIDPVEAACESLAVHQRSRSFRD
jgi:hypothetical protein